MGATMGDIGALDNGITQILHILDHKDGWDEENSEAAMDGQDEDLVADAEKAVNEKGVLTDNADGSAYTKAYEASGVSDLSCDLKYEELVLKTWNEAKVQVKVTGKNHNRQQPEGKKPFRRNFLPGKLKLSEDKTSDGSRNHRTGWRF